MQATACFHDGVANAIFQQAYLIFHNPVAFHASNSVFNPDPDGGNTMIVGLLRWSEFSATRFFLGLHDCHIGQDEPLESHILIETTSRG